VHPQLHYAHQQLLQYTSLLPRAHRIETKVALRHQGSFPGGEREKLWREFFLHP
jgi:hypothetical protein